MKESEGKCWMNRCIYRAPWVNLLLVPGWLVLQIDSDQLDLFPQTLKKKEYFVQVYVLFLATPQR